MDLILIAIVAFLASGLTLYSGFGLGTVLLPVFALFFPVPVAVAATGVVHLFNNLFKGALLWTRADWPVVWRFGLPAIPAAAVGAWFLSFLVETPRLFDLHLAGRSFGPTGAGLTIGLLMILFALLELQKWFQALNAPPKLMPLGGLITGFFGGLTGQQGAFRSMFLIKSGLSAQHFVATGAMIAILVDTTRLATYAASFESAASLFDGRQALLIFTGVAAAFSGAWFAARYIEKVTLKAVRMLVAGMMLVIGSALAAGVIGS